MKSDTKNVDPLTENPFFKHSIQRVFLIFGDLLGIINGIHVEFSN